MPARSGGMAILVIADSPRRVCRTEFVLLCNRFRKAHLTHSLKLSLHFAQLMVKAPASVRSNALNRAVVRIPVAFEIGDQRRAEMARRLFARVHRHIATKHIQRRSRAPNRAAMPAGATHPQTGEPGHDAPQRAIDFRGRGDLIADQPPSRRVAVEPAAIEDCLARYSAPGEPP